MADPEPADHVTIVAETYGRAANTVSSLKSEDSTEQLICKSPPKKAPKVKKEKSLRSKSVEPSVTSDAVRSRRLVVALGLAQLVLGALLAGGGALAVLKGAALARVGAGLWAGCVAVVAGVVGLLAGISDCYGVEGKKGSGLLTGFLALSLLALACGNSAAVLAATGLHRDAARPTPQPETFEEEMEAWTPVLTNIVVLIVAGVQCLVCVVAVYHLSRRLCSCLQPQPQFDHNQFDATSGKPPATYLVHVDEGKKGAGAERGRGHELARELEGRLRAPGDAKQEGKQKKEEASYGSASSRSRLVSSWLGGQRGGAGAGGGGGRVRKARGAPVVLLPALPPLHMRMPHPQHHPASTLGRMPVSVMVPPRYATLPLPPYGPPPPHGPHGPHPQLYYPVHDPTRIRRRRSPASRAERRRRRDGRDRERDSQLTRSLERIHRKRRAERRAERERLSDAELKRTYTGLDRAYAEQFIAVCDESRSAAADRSDSLTSTASSDLTNHTRHLDF